MNSTAREAQAPSHRECLLPSVARTPSVTQVAPAKKITFLKRGDPRFAGVRLAVHHRAFKTFSALMDELSQRVPLSFGVRSVTTPRGLHGLSALEQLEDGGYYLCSDKKPPKTPGGPGRPQGRSPSAQQSRDFEGQPEAPGTSSSSKGPKAPRRVLLVKNGEPRSQQLVALSPRDTRNLAAVLSKASGVLHFPVKQVYTISGRKVDSLQTLPPVLVCAGHEAFRPLAMEDARRNGIETLAGLASRNKNGSWGPKAKRSVIHARSRPGSRPRRSSLLSGRSGLSDPPAPLHRAWVGRAPDGHLQDTPAQPGPLVASDGVKKKVRVNEDGSLDVEMKVRFHLLGEDTLLWSRRMGRACGEGPALGEVGPLCCAWEGHPGGCSATWGPRPCGAECEEACGRDGQLGPRYEIWTNPLHAAQGPRLASRRRSGLAQHPHCGGPRGQGAPLRGRRWDSISSASSSSHPEGSEPDSSCCPRTPEGSVRSGGLSAQSRATREAGPCPEAAGLGSRGAEGAASDLSASERGGQHQGCLGETSTETSQREVTQEGGPSSPALSPSALRNQDLQTETCGQGTGCRQARWESVTRLPLAPGHSGSWDTDGGSPPPAARASAQRGTRKQRTRLSAVAPPSSPGLGQVAQRGHARQCHHCSDTCCLADSPSARPAPSAPDPGGACPEGPARLSESSWSTQTQASRDRRAPSSGCLCSQDLPAPSRATTSPASHSDRTSGSCHRNAPSAGWAGDAGSRVDSPTPAPPPTPHSCSWARAGGTPEPSSPLALQVGRPDRGEAGAHRGSCCSQTGEPLVQGGPGGNTQALWAPSSEAAWVCSRYCPTPPRGRPGAERRPSSCGSSSGCHGAARGPGGSRQGEESPAVGCVLPLDPRGGSQGKTAGGGGGCEEQEEGGGVSPGALPHASPDAVVREWLGNIPEEPVLLKYEMADEATDVAGDGPESPKGDPGDGRSPEAPGGLAQARPQPPEGDAGENPEPDGALPGPGSARPSSGEGPSQGAALGADPKASVEARVGGGVAVGHAVPLRVLPARVSASTHIMKALMGSKQGRPSSLPEVSGPAARRLSRSAGALITCLAQLHFFDGDLGSPAGKVRFADSPRYQELLSLSQALWPGCDLGHGQPDSSLQELPWSQALPGLGSHAVTEDLTPTSSSGVDLSSGSGGSGGSGEGSVPCAADCALGLERVEPPQKTSCQRPDSRGSEDAEGLGNPRPSCCPASPHSQAPSEGQAGGDGGEPGLGSPPGQAVGHATQEEGARLEETRGGVEGGELREAVREEGLPEEGRVGRPGADDEGQEEEAGRASPPAARTEEPPEPPGQLSARDPHAREDQSGLQFGPGLEDPPGAAGVGHGQTPASPPRGAGEKRAPMVGRASLDPDPIWASAMLKKMAKAFMAHLAGAVAELRARWSLQDHPLLDQMAAELQQDVRRRLQDGTQRELREMQSRAGRRAPGPPREALSGELSLQTERRRRCLRGLRHLSAFSECTPGLGSLSLEDGPALGTRLGGVAEPEEFCPCEACIRKKVSPVSPTDAVGTTRAPIKEAFDLQQILQKRRGGCPSGDAAEVAPEKTGTEQLQEDPSSTGPSRGADDGLELGPGVQGEEGQGSQRRSRDDSPQPEGAEEAGRWEGGEDAGAPRREGNGPASVGSNPGAAERQEARDQGSGGEDSLEGEASARGDRDPGGQSEGAAGVGAREADGEGRPGSGAGTQGERGGSPLISSQQGQSEDASENGSLDQEGRPVSPPAPGGDSPRQSPDPQTGASPSSPPCLGSCSQKDSEDDASGDVRITEAEPEGDPRAERKVTRMYPESSTSEQEGAPSRPQTPEQGAGKGSDLQDEEAATSRPSTGVAGRADGFGQDDLDF